MFTCCCSISGLPRSTSGWQRLVAGVPLVRAKLQCSFPYQGLSCFFPEVFKHFFTLFFVGGSTWLLRHWIKEKKACIIFWNYSKVKIFVGFWKPPLFWAFAMPEDRCDAPEITPPCGSFCVNPMLSPSSWSGRSSSVCFQNREDSRCSHLSNVPLVTLPSAFKLTHFATLYMVWLIFRRQCLGSEEERQASEQTKSGGFRNPQRKDISRALYGAFLGWTVFLLDLSVSLAFKWKLPGKGFCWVKGSQAIFSSLDSITAFQGLASWAIPGFCLSCC